MDLKIQQHLGHTRGNSSAARAQNSMSICNLVWGLGCKLKNTFGTGMCKFGLGGAFYRRSLTLVCVFTFKCDCQGLCNDVFNGVARKMQRLLAIAAALCAVTVSSHRQTGRRQHPQITLRRAESFLSFQVSQKISQAPLKFLTRVLHSPPWGNSWSLYTNNFVFSKVDV